MEQKVIAYIQLDPDSGLAMIVADSIKPCPLLDGMAVLSNTKGLSEKSFPLIEVNKLRVKMSAIEYVLEGQEKSVDEFTSEKIAEQKEKENKPEIEHSESSNFP